MTTQRDLDRDFRAYSTSRPSAGHPTDCSNAALAGIESTGSGRACSSPIGGGRGSW